jgi:NADH-quinone oxidoreductase subunit G
MMIETRDNVVVRLRPRPNDDVNKYFMCDHGRLTYRWMNRPDRVDVPHVRGSAGMGPTDWDGALALAAKALAGKRAFVLASPMLSNEALYLLSRITKKTGGTGVFRVPQGTEAPLPGVEDLSLRKDRAANAAGAELFGFTRSDNPLSGYSLGDVLIVADEELADAPPPTIGNATVIVIGTTLPPWAAARASVVLPTANMSEEEGTFTNVRGRVQRFLQAKAAPGFARPSWWVLSDLLAAMGGETTNYFLASDVFNALAKDVPAFNGLSYDALGMRGKTLNGRRDSAGASA